MPRSIVLAALAVLLLGRGAAADACRYSVSADASAGAADLVLDVAIDCDRPFGQDDFVFRYGGEAFADWAEDGRLAYRLEAGRLARSRRPHDFAATARRVLAPIDAWLAGPVRRHGVSMLEITEALGGPVRLHTNLRPGPDGAGWRLARDDWFFGGYTVFSAAPLLRARAPGPAAYAAPGRSGPAEAEIGIAVLDDGFRLSDADIVQWIEWFSGMVANFWAGFPSDRLLIAVTDGGRREAPFGRVRGGGGATMMLRLHRDETPAFLNERDWVLTHELVHLGAPFARSRRPWFMEGMATYLEPVIRALGGGLTREAVWAEWLRAMGRGESGIAANGLEGPGHPYWTGAAYFLLAHVELARAGEADGLAHCFRAMRRELGDASSRSTVDRLIAVCDRTLGRPLLSGLRARLAEPADIDLAELWRSLGVTAAGGRVIFSPQGAGIRRMMFDSAQFSPPAS